MSVAIRSGLVTGASRGIGRTIALRLAQNGFGLTVTSRKADDLAALGAELRRAGAPEVRFRAADMADRAALPAIVDLHAQHFGALDALVLSGATKAAMLSLMETVNLEESPLGVTATAIAPAYVDTDMSDWIKGTIPADTMIPADDVASVVELILSLSSRTSITKILMSRSRTSGYCA